MPAGIGSAGHVAFSTDGALVVGNSDGLKAADFEKGELVPILKRPIKALSADGARVLVDDHQTVAFLNVKTQREVRLLDRNYRLKLTSLAVSSDGGHVLTGGKASPSVLRGITGSDNAISLWDAATGRLIRTSRLPENEEIAALSFAPEGATAFSHSYLGRLTQWNATTGERIRSIDVGSADANVPRMPMDLTADGTRLVTASGNALVLWDVVTTKALRSFEGHARVVNSVAISPDGTRVAAGSHDGKVRIWNATTGGLVHTFDVSWARRCV